MQPCFRPLFTLVFARPSGVVARWHLHFVTDLLDGLSNGGPQIPAPDVERDCHITLVALAIDVVSSILDFYLGQLRKRDSLSGGGEEADLFDGLLGVPVRLLIANHQVVYFL